MKVDWNDPATLADLKAAAIESFRWLEKDAGYGLIDRDERASVHGMSLEYRAAHGRLWVVISIIGETAEVLIVPAGRSIGWTVSHNAFLFVRGWRNPGRDLRRDTMQDAVERIREQSESLKLLVDAELSGDYSRYERAFAAMRAREPDYSTGS